MQKYHKFMQRSSENNALLWNYLNVLTKLFTRNEGGKESMNKKYQTKGFARKATALATVFGMAVSLIPAVPM